MKRNYKYEREMLHWLDGGEIKQKWDGYNWEPFNGSWFDTDEVEYRIAEPAEKSKEERWIYVNQFGGLAPWLTDEISDCTIGKIRMEDV